MVEHLIRIVAPREEERVAHHDGWCTTTQRRTYVIAIHSHTMVQVVAGKCGYQFGFSLFALLFQGRNLWMARILQFVDIVDNHIGRTLQPDIYTISLLSHPLKGGTIEAVSSAVVLNHNVIQPLGVMFDKHEWLSRRGLAGFQLVRSCTVRSDAGKKQQLTVVCPLIGLFYAECVKQHQLRIYLKILHLYYFMAL